MGFIEGVRAEHDLHKICRSPAGVHVLVQLALLLHGVQGRLDVVVIDVVGGVIAGADVDIVTGLGHGPGVALAPVLKVAGQDTVHLSGAQRGVGDLVDGVAALGVNTLLQGLVADGVVVIADDGCQCAVITRASRTAVQALNALCMLSRSFEIIYLSLNEEHFIYHMCTDRHTVS